jgi:iron(III) transport system permease protein
MRGSLFCGGMLLAAAAALGWLAAADARIAALLGNTLLLAGGVALAALPIGVALGWLVARTDLPGRRVTFSLLAALLFLPLYVQAAAWDAGFGLQGSLTRQFLGGEVWLNGMPAVIWIHALAAIPWAALCVALGVSGVERELEEQALLEMPAWQVALRVSLRRAAPALGLALVGILLATATETTVTDLFRVRTFAEELFTMQQLGDDRGLRTVVLASLVATAWLVTLALVVGASLATVVRARRPNTLRTFPLGSWRWPSWLAVTVILLFAVGAPVACLAFKAGLIVEMQGATRVRHWSTAGAAMTTWRSVGRFREELGWSCAAATVAACVAAACAAPLAWIARRGGWRGWITGALGVTMLATPGSLLAMALMRALSQPNATVLLWLRDQPLSCLVVVQGWRAFPWALGILWFALRTVPEAQLDVAMLDGLGAWARFWRVGLAQHRGALAAAWVVAFTIAIGELPASVLVAPPGVVTLPIQVFNQLHYGAEKEVAGICLAVVLMQTGLVVAALRPRIHHGGHGEHGGGGEEREDVCMRIT